MAESGDGAGQGALGEPARAAGQDPVEGVHHDLAGEGGQLVAGGPGPGALVEEAGQHLGQDPRAAGEEGAVRGAQQLSRHPGTVLRVPIGGPGAGAARLQVGQGIDVEGADDRGVQALEVEDIDVPVEPRPAGHDQAPRRALLVHPVDAGGGRHHAALPQAGEVEEVEGRHRAPGALQGQAGEAGPPQAEAHEVLAQQDVAHQPRVLEAVPGEGGAVVAEGGQDAVGHGVALGGLEGLAAAEEGEGHRVQAVVLEALQGGPHEMHGVEDLAAVHDDAAAAPDVALLVPRLVGGAAQVEGHAVGPAQRLEHREVEVDQVPAGEHVRVQLADPRQEPGEQLGLGGVAAHLGGVAGGGLPGQVDLLHLLAAAAPGHQGAGQQAAGVGGGLDVEGQQPQVRLPVAGADLRVDVDPVDAVTGPPRPADAQGAPHPAGHEPLPREGDVGLVGAQLLPVDPLGEAAQLPGLAQADAHHRLAVHGGQTRAGVQLGAGAEAGGPRPGQLGLAQVEGGQEAAVGEGEGRPRLQAADAEEDGPPVLLAVEEVQEEAALGIAHRGLL